MVTKKNEFNFEKYHFGNVLKRITNISELYSGNHIVILNINKGKRDFHHFNN